MGCISAFVAVLAPLVGGLTGSAIAFEVGGTVMDAAGGPVSGASVWLVEGFDVMRTETNEAGRFEFPDRDVGFKSVVAWKEGSALDSFNGMVVGPFQMELRLAVSGSLALRIVDSAYDAIEGAALRWLQVDQRFAIRYALLAKSGFPSARSDKEGALDIVDLPAGAHVRCVVSHREHADTDVAYLPVGGDRQVVILYPSVALRGQVTAPDGRGVPMAQVTASKATTAGQMAFGEALSDPEGFYVMRLRPGEYAVSVCHPDFASPPSIGLSLGTEAEDHVADLALLAPHAIEGEIHGPDDTPFPGVLLSYRVGDAWYGDVWSRADGSFRIVVPTGKGRLHVDPPDGFMTDDLPVIPVEMGETPAVTLRPLRLTPLPEVEGIVRMPEGVTPEATLIASMNVDPPLWALTDEEGRFRVRLGHMPEEAKATFRAEHGRRFLRSEFTVDLRKNKPVDTTLEPFEPDLAPTPERPEGNDLSGLIGERAPEIACDPWFDSPESLTLETLRGRVVVILFWAGFDARPETLNQIERLRAVHMLLRGDDEVAFVGVHDSTSSPDEVRAYVEHRRIAFPVGRDLEPAKTFDRYHVQYIPEIVLVDRAGVVRYGCVGDRLPELIKALRREAK
ncbi:MAG TPA: carboxypeptidase regulatory-like domain-containing protein [Candidatus Hydrogenedentes bacterium]|nr:carboxypeptidase regulatory-like domain-containing protein [Candidatus Hydrogenedentota bacterium]HPG66337.1 carboxypeptidase regulatory-like domain-containing protein [Candidatus Hydrogenedentota bacterium]